MEGDTRLVYTVDCVVDETGQVRIQGPLLLAQILNSLLLTWLVV